MIRPRAERLRGAAHRPRRRAAAGARPRRLLLRRADPGRRHRRPLQAARSRRSSATSPPRPTARASRAASRQADQVRSRHRARSTLARSPRRRRRTRVTRINPYRCAGGLHQAGARASTSFITAQCTERAVARPSTGPATSPEDLYAADQRARARGRGQPDTDDVPAPPCNATRRRSRRSAGRRGESTDYLHVEPAGLSRFQRRENGATAQLQSVSDCSQERGSRGSGSVSADVQECLILYRRNPWVDPRPIG